MRSPPPVGNFPPPLSLPTVTAEKPLVALTTLAYDIIANRLRNTSLHLRLLDAIQRYLHRTLGLEREFRLFLINLRTLFQYTIHPGGRPQKQPDPCQLNFLFQQ